MVSLRKEHMEKMTLEEFYTFAENDPEHKYELIDGYPRMMTGGSPDHSIIGVNLVGILRDQLRKRPCIPYNSDVFVALADRENRLCPDASVSCDPRDRQATKAIQYPCVIAEVLSPSTADFDRGTKADYFQSIPTVQEILFIYTQIMRIQLFRRETDFWSMRNFMQDDVVELTSLGITFQVAEVYEKTTFDPTFAPET